MDDYDIEDLLKLSDAEFEKLYAQLGLNTTIDDDILLEDDFDIEDIAEELDEEPEKIEILFRRKGLGDDYVAPEKQAVMTENRIDERIAEHGAGNNAGYALDYREKYDEIFSRVIQSSKYKNAKDAAKAELLEDTRDDVLDATKEEFFEWLKASGVRSTKKQK